jgi:hypothetical protein
MPLKRNRMPDPNFCCLRGSRVRNPLEPLSVTAVVRMDDNPNLAVRESHSFLYLYQLVVLWHFF